MHSKAKTTPPSVPGGVEGSDRRDRIPLGKGLP